MQDLWQPLRPTPARNPTHKPNIEILLYQELYRNNEFSREAWNKFPFFFQHNNNHAMNDFNDLNSNQ